MLGGSRNALAALAALAAGCTLVAPLGGLTGGGVATPDASTDAPASDGVVPVDAADSAADAAVATEASTDAGSAYAAAVLADAPLAYWRLGDAPGSGTCHDATGNGNDAQVVGGVTLGVAGALVGDPDTAAHFDGTSGLLDVGDKFEFAGTAPLTIEIWANPDLIDDSYRHLESKMLYNDAGNPYDGIYLYVHGGTTLGYERWGDGTIDQALLTPVVAASSWSYIVATFDGSIESLFVDGQLEKSGPTSVSVSANGVDLLLGQFFQGTLDEVAIYGIALSFARVQAHWQASGR